MTTIIAIKTNLYKEYEGFIESVIKSSYNMIQNRFYLHENTKIIEKSSCIILLQIKGKEYAEYVKKDLEQIKEISVKLINFD